MEKVHDILHQSVCVTCGKVEMLAYKTLWYRNKQGTGKCNSCSKKGGNSGSFTRETAPWNKGLMGYGTGHASYNNMQGIANPNWKGDNVGYFGLHLWVSRHKGKPSECEHCGLVDKINTRRFFWANISHEYKRDLSDWARLCGSCHKRYDLGTLALRKS